MLKFPSLLLCFVASAAATALLLQRRHRAFAISATAREPLPTVVTNEASCRLYDCALLELLHPPLGPMQMPQTLQNDALLMRVAREVNDTLYVYVVERQHAAGEPSPNMCEYISSIYSRMWDEMMQADNLSLNCIVIGDLKDSGYVSLPELRAKKELAALYTFDRTAAQQVQDLRQRCGLQKVSLLEYDATSAVLSQPQLVEGGQIHFLDSATGGMPLPRFSRVAIGGTFDRLHNGHKKLLALAAGCTSGVLVVGISGDALLANKRNASKISSYAVRQQEVLNFLRLVKPLLVVEPVELSDPYGPTVTDASIEALVASSETLPGAEKINKLRKEKGFQPLAVLISRRGDSATLSSTFLRANAK